MLVAASLCFAVPATHAGDDFLQMLRIKYGADAALRGHQLGLLLEQLRSAPKGEQLHRINRFFNAFRFRADNKQWAHEDYWASPVEFIGRFAGDCEDYAIAKYFALRWLGVASETMQLSYVHNSLRDQFHVVLQVRAEDGAEVMILDNMNPHVLPASQRQELTKIVGFGETHIAVTLPGGGERKFSRAGRWSVRQWDGVLLRTGGEPQPTWQRPQYALWHPYF